MNLASDRHSAAAYKPASARTQIVSGLLVWYDRDRRDLPWRSPPGVRPDPYRVWLSEIMLQQTTVKTVVPYFAKFVARWPTLDALAASDLDDVLRVWAGLGYYSRARNLHACAKAIMERQDGRFPDNEAELAALPGIGTYTAAAIAAIAFDRPAPVVDGNVERVTARLNAVETPLPRAKAELRRLAATLVPQTRAGDFAQAMMDLGATICTPRRPSCLICPIAETCRARELGLEAVLPLRATKADKPTRRGTAFFLMRDDGRVLLRRRPEKGLLGGMLEVPSGEWRVDGAWQEGDEAPLPADWRRLTGVVRHTFTHFHLELQVYRALCSDKQQAPEGQGWRWVHRRDLAGEALPSVMRKVIAHALGPSSPKSASR